MDFIDTIVAYSNKHGGGTFDVTRERVLNPNSGYFVSLHGKGKKVGADVLTRKVVEKYLKLVGHPPKLGTWFNEETGEWFLDVTFWIGCLDQAIRFGKQQKQIAIWDCAAGREFRL